MRLYCCRIPPELRACLLDTVGCFAISAHDAAAIWARLEQTNVLSEVPSAWGGGGGHSPLTMTPNRWLAGPPTPAGGLVTSNVSQVADIRHQLNQVRFARLLF